MKKEDKKKVYDDDDGRTIADMNVEGMPWYNPYKGKNKGEQIQLTKKEEKLITRGVMLSSFLAATIYMVAFFLILLFCVFVWFK